MEDWVKKSKTLKGSLATIVLGIYLILVGVGAKPPATIDDLDKKADDTASKVIGLGALASGGLATKGRFDAQKKIKEKKDET